MQGGRWHRGAPLCVPFEDIPRGDAELSSATSARSSTQLRSHMQASIRPEPGNVVFRHSVGKDERMRCSALWFLSGRTVSMAGVPGRGITASSVRSCWSG